MPIDTSLYGKFAPPPRESPFTQLSQFANAQTAIGQLRQQQQAQADQAAIRQVLTETGGNIKEALPRLRTIAPAAALDFESKIAEQQKHAFDALKSQTELESQRLDIGMRGLAGVNDDRTHQIWVRRMRAIDPEIAEMAGPRFDPARREELLQIGTTAKDALEHRRHGLDKFNSGDAFGGLAMVLSTAQHQQDWEKGIAAARERGVTEDVIAQFGTQFSPEAKARATELGITPAKRAELAGQAAGRAQTAAHQAVIESQGAQRIAIARQRLAQGTGTSQDRDDLISAVVDNPGLWDQITPTERGKIAGDLQRRGFTGFGRPLPEAAVKKLAESDSAIASLADLREILKKNEQYIGPIAGLAALNPYSEARKAQADIDLVRQRVGKALEGGVLRKEDEEKYKKILATLRDEPSTAIYKVDQLIKDIQRDKDTYVHQQRLAGRRVPQSESPGAAETRAPTAAGPGGMSYQDYLKKKGS